MRPERYYHPSVGFYEHMPAWRVREYVDEVVWRTYFKFAFDRNPWDRQVSWYFYKTKAKLMQPSFERFMANRRRAFVSNYAIYSLNGSVAVDFVGQFEAVENDLARALETIGVKRQLTLPRTNVSPGRPPKVGYREYYSDVTKALVTHWYAPEISLLGYEF
jgi:Sulfotransferase family